MLTLSKVKSGREASANEVPEADGGYQADSYHMSGRRMVSIILCDHCFGENTEGIRGGK